MSVYIRVVAEIVGRWWRKPIEGALRQKRTSGPRLGIACLVVGCGGKGLVRGID